MIIVPLSITIFAQRVTFVTHIDLLAYRYLITHCFLVITNKNKTNLDHRYIDKSKEIDS